MAEIRFFFEYKNQVVQLPYNPESVEVVTSGNNETAEIVSIGEINILKDKKLSEISIESFFPVNSSPPYVLTKGKFKNPKFYIDFFAKVRNAKASMRLVVSGTSINMLVGIEEFNWKLEAGSDDVYYTLSLKQHKNYKVVTKKVSAKNSIYSATSSTSTASSSKKSQSNSNKKVTVGCDVIANGYLHRDSYGTGRGQYRKNYRGKINYIVKGRSHPYHLTTPTGGWQGWMLASAIRVI